MPYTDTSLKASNPIATPFPMDGGGDIVRRKIEATAKPC